MREAAYQPTGQRADEAARHVQKAMAIPCIPGATICVSEI